MAEQVKFAGEQGALTIEVCGYERPKTQDQDDANWLKCELAVKIGPFAGMFRTSFTTHELSILMERLKGPLAALSGSVSFQNTEGDIELDIAFGKRGSAIVKGRVRAPGYPETSLQFELDSDQSYLTQTLRQLQIVLHAFPIKQVQ